MTHDRPAVLRHLLLSLADDELVLGHRDSEWTAFAPFIEEDVALASIAQDEISHASVFLGLLRDVTGEDPDQLAFLRPAGEWRNARLLERPNGDWAYTMARHLAYDLFDDLRLQALARSAFPPLAEAVDRLRREERYHLLHGRAWLARLAGSDGEARERLVRAVDAVMADAAGLFEMTDDDRDAAATGVFPGAPEALAAPWAAAVRAELEPFGLGALVPDAAALARPPADALGGRRGDHSPHLPDLLAALGEVYRSDPRAAW